MKVYLAGPMTGVPQFNYPLFDAVAAKLRTQGYEVVTPSELDEPIIRRLALESPHGDPKEFLKACAAEGAPTETWGQFLARDIKIVADEIDAIVLLPLWWHSRGAVGESTFGILAGRKFFEWSDRRQRAIPINYDYVADMIHGKLLQHA